MIARILAKALPVVLALVSASFAQTTYTSVFTSVNLGEPSMVTFQFGHKVDGTPGTTELIVQCAFGRAELITNFDVYGQQASSGFFYPNCLKTGQKSYVLTGLPETFNLTMSDGTLLTLTINSANWAVVPCRSSRWGCGVGSAQIVIGPTTVSAIYRCGSDRRACLK